MNRESHAAGSEKAVRALQNGTSGTVHEIIEDGSRNDTWPAPRRETTWIPYGLL